MEIVLKLEDVIFMANAVKGIEVKNALLEIQKVSLNEAGIPTESALDNCHNTLAVIYALATEALEVLNVHQSCTCDHCSGAAGR